MSGRKRLIVLANVTLLAGAVVMFPARVAYHLFVPPDLRLAAINGTVWNGSAAEGQVARLYLRNLRWSFKPWSLFAGRLEFETSFDPAGGFLQADVGIGPGGTITLTNVDGGVSIGALQSIVPLPGIDGNLRMNFSRLRIDDGAPTAADGTLEVAGLIARGLSTAPLGDFRAILVSSDDGISGSVEDLAGVLDIAGSLRVSLDRSYSLTGLVAPTASAPRSVVEQLRFLGSPNERGQREFRFEGEL